MWRALTLTPASDAWVNNGTIVSNNCVVDLGGWLTYDPSVNNLATLNLSSDAVYLSGTVNNTGRTLTFSPNVTSSTGSWILDGGRIDGGTIAGSLLSSGGTLDGVTNNGVIDVSGSYATTFQGAWANAGTISIASGAVVNLAGTFTTDTFDNLAIAAGATVNVTGTLDNREADNPQSEGTLALGDSTGPLALDGGTILGGDITTDGTNDLVATLAGGTLDGVTLDGTLDITQYAGSFTTEKFTGASVTVLNGLTVNGLIELGGASGTSNAGDLVFGSPNDDIAQTIDGSGTIQFGQDNAGDVLLDASNDPLTFGPGLTVQAGLHSYIESAAGIVNLGKITNPSGGSLGIQADLTNSGTIDAGTGTLTITNYTQTSADPETGTPAGVLDIEIGGLSQFGKLAVAGNAALGGTLNLALVNGYVPNNLDTFGILTYGQVRDDFAETQGLGAGGDNYFSPDYNMTAPLTLTMTVTNNGNTPNPVIYWTGDAGDDNWDDPGNWSTDDPLVSNVPESVLPGPFDNVVIDLSHQTINHAAARLRTDQQPDRHRAVRDAEPFRRHARPLGRRRSPRPLDRRPEHVPGRSRAVTSSISQGTDLKNAIITSGTTLTAAPADSVLDNVTLDGTLDMTQHNDAYVQMIDAVTINGTVELGGDSNYASLYFGYQNDAFGMTVAGTGTIQFGQGRQLHGQPLQPRRGHPYLWNRHHHPGRAQQLHFVLLHHLRADRQPGHNRREHHWRSTDDQPGGLGERRLDPCQQRRHGHAGGLRLDQ